MGAGAVAADLSPNFFRGAAPGFGVQDPTHVGSVRRRFGVGSSLLVNGGEGLIV